MKIKKKKKETLCCSTITSVVPAVNAIEIPLVHLQRKLLGGGDFNVPVCHRSCEIMLGN